MLATATASSSISALPHSGLYCRLAVGVNEYSHHIMRSLTRASAKNAIGRQMLREMMEVLDVLRQESTTRCVVLRR